MDEQERNFRRMLQVEAAQEKALLNIQRELDNNPPPYMTTVWITNNDAKAKKDGWPSAQHMKDAIEETINILPTKYRGRIQLKNY